MATKSDPGKFDCYAKAADDEPIFTLRAKDPIAPGLIRAWRFLRAGDIHGAEIQLRGAHFAWGQSGRTNLPFDSEKSQEAERCAVAMERWREKEQPK
jgi:hypothetical protein